MVGIAFFTTVAAEVSSEAVAAVFAGNCTVTMVMTHKGFENLVVAQQHHTREMALMYLL